MVIQHNEFCSNSSNSNISGFISSNWCYNISAVIFSNSFSTKQAMTTGELPSNLKKCRCYACFWKEQISK